MTILFTCQAHLARLTLNRPERLNSFNELMHVEIRAALDRVEAEGARVLVITGAGRAFCAGQDLAERSVAPDGTAPDLGDSVERNYAPLVKRLRELPLPVIAAVNGVAAGAGANLALACDLVVAAESARFIQPFCKLGLIPDTGGSYALPRLVGPARAFGLALLGDAITARQAADWGLIWDTVPDDAFAAHVDALAERLATGPTFGYAQTKRALNASLGNSLTEQLALEAELMRQCGRSADYREGVAAFLEKRPPKFLGR